MGLTAQIKGFILRSSCCFFPFLQKPQGSGFIVFSVLSSLKITHKANNWFSCCLFPMRIQMSASTQCLFLPTKTNKQKFVSPPEVSLPAPSLLHRPTRCFGESINEKTKANENVRVRSSAKPTLPTKNVWGQTAGQMFELKLASCYSTSNSDVTLGAFSKWFKYLHPLSAVEGMLNQRAIRAEKEGYLSQRFIRIRKLCTL